MFNRILCIHRIYMFNRILCIHRIYMFNRIYPTVYPRPLGSNGRGLTYRL